MTLNLRIVFTTFLLSARCWVRLRQTATLRFLNSAWGIPVQTSRRGNAGYGVLIGTTSDGNAGTTGDQDAAIEYTGFLDPRFADGTGSFSVAGLLRTGPPNVCGGTVMFKTSMAAS